MRKIILERGCVIRLMQAKRDNGISLCRSLATLMIVVCHFGTAYDYSYIGQFFQSGVQVFLLISGVLYGDKIIQDKKQWLLNRWKRISLPCYIHVLVITLICVVSGIPISYIGVAEIFLNIEGYHHIITFFPNPWVVKGTAHFWFVTVIILCYVMVALIKKCGLDAVTNKSRKSFVLILFIFSIITGFLGIRIDYYLIFIIGYYFSDKLNKQCSNKRLIISAALFTLAVAFRLVVKRYCDVYGDNNFYLYVVIPISYNAIAISIYCFVVKIGEQIDKTNIGSSYFYEKSILLFDSLSYYIFITHYMLIDGPISLISFSPYWILNIISILAGTILLSIVLKHMSDWLVASIYIRGD